MVFLVINHHGQLVLNGWRCLMVNNQLLMIKNAQWEIQQINHPALWWPAMGKPMVVNVDLPLWDSMNHAEPHFTGDQNFQGSWTLDQVILRKQNVCVRKLAEAVLKRNTLEAVAEDMENPGWKPLAFNGKHRLPSAGRVFLAHLDPLSRVNHQVR